MPQDQSQPQTLAQMVRSKFPGQYDDLNDTDLESKVLAKYPEYSDLPRSSAQPSLNLPHDMTISAQPKSTGVLNSAENWLRDLENDIKTGGTSTIGGRIYKGLGGQPTSSGVPESVGNFMASPVLGPLQAARGATEIPQKGKTWQGTKDLVGGTLDAATIPAAFMGGPATEGAANLAGRASLRAFGNVEHAGELFDTVRAAAQDQPIQLTDEVYDALGNIKQLADAGAKGTPRAASKLANRLNNVDEELYWDEARRFYTNISRLSANEYNSMNPQMQRAVGQLGRALGDTLQNAAESVGKGSEYQQAMAEYAKSKAWQQFGSDAWQFVKRAAPYVIGVGAGGRIALNALDKVTP